MTKGDTMLESALQNKISSYLKKHNRFYIKTQAGPGTATGTPDIITLDDNGVLVGLELKRDDGVGSYGVTPEQYYQGSKIKAFNGRRYAIKSFTEFLEVSGLERGMND